jgi:hypothetical protein
MSPPVFMVSLLQFCPDVALGSFYLVSINIVTNMTTARQRFGKHIPEVTQSTAVRLLLGSKSLGTFRSNGQNNNNNRRSVRGGVSSIRPEL